jgi:hypothetical protein
MNSERHPSIYLDSSALVKRYLVEAGTPWMMTFCGADARSAAAMGCSVVPSYLGLAAHVWRPFGLVLSSQA